jgi:hypothetical protein
MRVWGIGFLGLRSAMGYRVFRVEVGIWHVVLKSNRKFPNSQAETPHMKNQPIN